MDSRRPAVERPLPTFRSFYRRMARGVLLALAIAAVLIAVSGGRLPGIALPFLLLWLAAPLIAWRISRTPPAVAKSDAVDASSSASCA